MNRYEIALNKDIPLKIRVHSCIYKNNYLIEKLLATDYYPLRGDMDLFEKYKDEQLSFWWVCQTGQKPNELGKILMNIRNHERFMRIEDQRILAEMKKAAMAE